MFSIFLFTASCYPFCLLTTFHTWIYQSNLPSISGWDSITNEILVSSILEIVTERDSSNMVNTNELPIMTGDEGYSTQHSSTQQSIVYQSKGDDIVNESSTKEQTSTGIYTERKAKRMLIYNLLYLFFYYIILCHYWSSWCSVISFL